MYITYRPRFADYIKLVNVVNRNIREKTAPAVNMFPIICVRLCFVTILDTLWCMSCCWFYWTLIKTIFIIKKKKIIEKLRLHFYWLVWLLVSVLCACNRETIICHFHANGAWLIRGWFRNRTRIENLPITQYIVGKYHNIAKVKGT